MLAGIAACGGDDDRVRRDEHALDVQAHILPTVGVGTLPGELDVGADGAASYAVSLALPPGRHGIAPALAVVYSSNGGDGILGPGFTISGLSAISRCPPSVDRDGKNDAVVLEETDRLCLDGQRLEPEVNGTDYWAAGTYIVRENPLIRVYAETSPTVQGVHHFIVKDGAGKIFTYGGSIDSNVTAPTLPPTPVSWLLKTVEDLAGNYYKVEYDVSMTGGDLPTELPEHAPHSIAYTGFAGIAPSSKIEFSYTARTDRRQGYRFGFVTARTQLLERITTSTDGFGVREYRFEYEPDAHSGVSHLVRMLECTLSAKEGENACKPPTTFTWSIPTELEPESPAQVLVPTTVTDWNPITDADQDVAPGGGASSLRVSPPASMMALDFDGDGIQDVAYFDNPRASGTSWVGDLMVRFGDLDPSVALTRVMATEIEGYPGAVLTRVDVDHDGRDGIVTWNDTTETLFMAELEGDTITATDTGLGLYGTPGGAVPAGSTLRVADMNADGQDDLLVCGFQETCEIEVGASPEFQLVQALTGLWLFCGFGLCDPGPDWEIAYSCPGRWYYAQGNGTGFSPWQDTGIEDRCFFARESRVGDFDGDGGGDLLITPHPTDTTGALRVMSMRDPGSFAAKATSLCFSHESWDCAGLQEIAGGITTADVNGDGNHDLVVSKTETQTDGDHFNAPHVIYGSGSAGQPLRDLHRALGPNGDTYYGIATNLLDPNAPNGEYLYFHPIAADLNGDGRADFLQPAVLTQDITCQISSPFGCLASGWAPGPMDRWDSNGYVFTPRPGIWSWKPPLYQLTSTTTDRPVRRSQFLTLDANGDGAQDIIQVEEGPEDASPRTGRVQLHFNVGGLPRMVTRVTNGLGKTTSVTYAPLTDRTVYTPGTDCVYPVECVADRQYVVSAILRDNGLGKPGEPLAVNRTRYAYHDLRRDLWARQSAGFAQRTEIDDRTGRETAYYYDNQFSLGSLGYVRAGKPERIVSWLAAAGPQGYEGNSSTYHANVTEYVYDTALLDPPFAYTRPTTSRARTFEGMREEVADLREPEASLTPVSDVATTYTYDSFGLVEQTSTAHADGYGENRTVVRPAVWSPSVAVRVTSETVSSHDADGRTAKRTTTRVFDTLARVIQETAEPGDAEAELVTEVTARDAFGNPTRVVATPAVGAVRSVNVGYDPSGIFPTGTENALGHTRTQTYHPGLGVVVASIDENGLETRAFYDGFGRTRRLDRPGNADTTIDYRIPTSSLLPLEIEQRTLGRAHSIATLGRLGQRLFEEYRGFRGRWLKRARTFDARGLLLGESRPFDPAVTPTASSFVLYDYDFLGRLLNVTRPSGIIERTWYGPNRRWDRDGEGHITERKLDSRGALAAVIEPTGGGSMEYVHGPFGALLRITDAKDNVTELGYDLLGRQISMDDPDRGLATFTLDSYGATIRVEHEGGSSSDFEHDVLGRLIERTDTESGDVAVTSFGWDASPHGIGLRSSALSPDDVELSYRYDTLSRPQAELTTLGSTTYGVAISYDGFGRPSMLANPEGFEVRYVLDDWGHLEKVERADGSALFTIGAVDLDGHIVSEKFGNGVKTSRTYGADGLLESVETRGFVHLAGTAGPAVRSFIEAAFAYDDNGNLETDVDAARGVTTTFTYDALDRLRTASGTDGTTQAWTYDPIGNLLSSPAGVLTYGIAMPDGSIDKPHAATQIGTETIEYDDRGRVIAGPLGNVKYTPFDLPATIETGVEETHFGYDALGRRTLKSAPDGKTVYIGDLYERRSAGRGWPLHVFHVPAAGRTVASVYRLDGRDPSHDVTQYLHAGRLGSVAAISDSSLKAMIQSYDPYGARRDEGTGTSPSEVGVNFGFTGHEHDEGTGLINMRGRIYAPKLGRFMTPDPIIQAPSNPQSLNAYSYVWNNPLNATDPTGFQMRPESPVLAPEDYITFDDEEVGVIWGQPNNPSLADGPLPHAPQAGTGAEEAGGETADPRGYVADIIAASAPELQLATDVELGERQALVADILMGGIVPHPVCTSCSSQPSFPAAPEPRPVGENALHPTSPSPSRPIWSRFEHYVDRVLAQWDTEFSAASSTFGAVTHIEANVLGQSREDRMLAAGIGQATGNLAMSIGYRPAKEQYIAPLYPGTTSGNGTDARPVATGRPSPRPYDWRQDMSSVQRRRFRGMGWLQPPFTRGWARQLFRH